MGDAGRTVQASGRTLQLVVHGTRDRTTSATNSKALVDAVRAELTAAAAVAGPDGSSADATFVHLRRGGHAMLRRAGIWNDLTADFVQRTGLGVLPGARLAQAIEAGDSVI